MSEIDQRPFIAPHPKSTPLLLSARLVRLPFWLLAALSLAGYMLLALWFPLQPHYDQLPLADVRTFTPSLGYGLGYALLLLLLYGLYGLAYQRLKYQPLAIGVWGVVLTAVCFTIPLLFTYPINANDIYRYIIRGRITSVYQDNPYLLPPSAFPTDPLLPLAGEWAANTSPYGPVWELTAAAITYLTGDNLLLGLIAFKLLGVLALLGSGLVIWLLLAPQLPPQRTASALLWFWNPALLLMFVIDAHNDILMLFWLLLGVWLLQRVHPIIGLVVMLLGALTKSIGLLALPFFWLSCLRQLPSAKAQGRFFIASGIAMGIVAGLAFWPFGSPLALVRRLLLEASTGGGFSISVLIILLNHVLGGMIAVSTVNRIVLGLFALTGLWLAWRTVYSTNGRSPLTTTADIFLAYLLQALSFRIWYTTWPFAWLLLDKGLHSSPQTRFRLRIGLWLLLTAQLSVIIYGHLRVFLLNGDYLWAHLIGVPLTFAVPFYLAHRQKATDNCEW